MSDIYLSKSKYCKCVQCPKILWLKKYKPENLDRFNNLTHVRVGWAGNSKFKDSENDCDLKGVEGIIKPAISELQQEGYDIELILADRNIKKIPQEEMPKFYNNIDLYNLILININFFNLRF